MKGRIKRESSWGVNMSMQMLFFLVLCCFFVSGFTGLIYEILWTRMIVKIIGSAPFAVSIVLTVFMGGLGLGSYIASKYIDRVEKPLNLIRLYGVLELLIGLYGIVLPLLLIAFKPLYSVLYNYLFEYFLFYNLLTFLGCAILLIIPVTCMGATLPILSRFFVTSLSSVGTHVGRLYGLNTIGAAVGSLASGFWLIALWGLWGTLAFAIILNAAIGIVCLWVCRHPGQTGQPEVFNTTGPEAPSDAREIEMVPGEESYGSLALVIFAVSGFCAMAYEVVWIKLLGLIVGPTTYSFTIVLVTFITGLALGSMFFGWLGDRVKDPMRLLLFTQVAAALSALVFSQIMGNSQIFFAKLIYHFKDNFVYLQLLKAFVLFAFMALPTFCLGATFPLVGKIYTRSLLHTGRSIGFAYAINSVGAVLGSFCAGFLLIPLMGKEPGLSLVIAFQILTALIIGSLIFLRGSNGFLRWIPLALPAIVGLCFILQYPHWDRKMLSVGKYSRFNRPKIKEMGWLKVLMSGTQMFPELKNGELVYYGDGIGGFTTVLKLINDISEKESFSLFNSGKPDASSEGDMSTQTLSAHFPMLFHPKPENLLVIGLASGITAGEVLHYPVKRLDILEINKQVVAASDFFKPWNNQVLADPRTNLIIQDGRAHLELTSRKYDVISSEPSNPWMAGLSALFTKDFFELTRGRLNDGGIFVQFIHSYQMDWDTFAIIGRTFSQVFPKSILVRTDPSIIGPDFLLVGFTGDGGLNLNVAAKNLPFARKSKNVVLLDHRLFYNLIVSEDLKWLFGDGPINSDINPILEYQAPKMMHITDPVIQEKLLANRAVGLSTSTRKIVEENMTDVDIQIDYMTYALSVLNPLFPIKIHVDYSKATTEQKNQFSDLMEEYCSNYYVRDFSFIEDFELRDKCVSIQLKLLNTVVDRSNDGNQAYFYAHMGDLSLKIDQLKDAVNYFNQAVMIDPDNPKVYTNLGTAMAKLGRLEESINHFSSAVRLNPDLFVAQFNLGCALSLLGKTGEADYHLSQALRIEPQNAEVHYRLGNLLAVQRKVNEASEYYQEALRIDPDHTKAQQGLKNILSEQSKAGK